MTGTANPRLDRGNGRGRGLFGGAPPWTPASLTGLVAWLTAGPTWCFTDAGLAVPCGDGDPVRVWVDRGGNAIQFAQATTAHRPTLFDYGAGVWGVEFDGVDDGITGTLGTAAADSQWILAGVVAPPTGGSLSIDYFELRRSTDGTPLFDHGDATTRFRVRTDAGNISPTGDSGTVPAARTRYTAGIDAAGGLSVRYGAGAAGTGSVTAGAVTLDQISLGARVDRFGGYFGRVVWHEAVIATGTDYTNADVAAYLQAAWGVG